jgi:hypothetical protein
MPRTTFSVVMGQWEQLLTTVAANSTDLSSLEGQRSQLDAVLEGAKTASLRQAALRAQLQQATRDVEGFLSEGRDLATRLRNGIRNQYGLKSEKLIEFGLQPRRRPQKPRTPPSEPAPEPAPKALN